MRRGSVPACVATSVSSRASAAGFICAMTPSIPFIRWPLLSALSERPSTRIRVGSSSRIRAATTRSTAISRVAASMRPIAAATSSSPGPVERAQRSADFSSSAATSSIGAVIRSMPRSPSSSDARSDTSTTAICATCEAASIARLPPRARTAAGSALATATKAAASGSVTPGAISSCPTCWACSALARAATWLAPSAISVSPIEKPSGFTTKRIGPWPSSTALARAANLATAAAGSAEAAG